MSYTSTKTYGHNEGLSCCFRQWRADHSHCKFLHGYALSVRIEFQAQDLDHRNWVVDFGNLGDLKQTLRNTFDHKTLVALDDPNLQWFQEGHKLGLLDLVTVSHVGCEMFASLVYEQASNWLDNHYLSPRCKVSSVEVSEHGANSAIYKP